MNWRFLDSQPTLKLIVVVSVALVLGSFVFSSLCAISLGSCDFGLPLRISFSMLLVLLFFFELNVIWEAGREKRPEKMVLGLMSSGLAVLFVFHNVSAVFVLLTQPLAVVDLRNIDVDLKWILTVGMFIASLGVYDQVVWIADKINKMRS